MIPAPCGTAEHPVRTMACLFLFYRILNFCMPFRVLGRLCRNIGMQGNVPVLRNEREGTESNGAVRKCSVIANQRARWCGNPPDFQTSWQQNQAVSIQPGGCHTSDVGHWFAATYFSNSPNILLRKKSILLTPRPWWRQCPRRFRRRWQAAHRRSPPGPWLPPASELRRRQRSFPWGYLGRSCS